MSPQEARALAMAHELQEVLGDLADLPQHGEGSRVDYAHNYMYDVIAMLEPREPPESIDATPVTRLRLVKA